MESDSGADHDVCGMSVAIDVVGGKWKLHLMWVLGEGPQRFSHIRRLLAGVSEKVLAENLRQLEASGVVHREIYPEVPPRVEYSLTPLGEDLNRALAPLEQWGERNRDQILGRTPVAAAS
ncbi:winged helix-turn-helix transcriptional regulator [Nocardia huaxiensis]|uniref:Helix-turn-helix transcriptional regulator n=1 Tax=Nocardia huaxiensis TaxID=2755382 RepID=A0A7D6ZQ14_9NOCA|nr:helix-turn-helix domain-containing protein [Nocardia huaxiensis]QLY30905.1 helix-turn-helix transcriptional regulator [Nocardia huaxiensis]UFS94416.1 helix-turn-helix transcriptional regulator [Nocardia huaxiensis]